MSKEQAMNFQEKGENKHGSQVCGSQVCELRIFCLTLCRKCEAMQKSFIYGKSVNGEYFTDRVKETQRLKMAFEAGLNTVIISPRRLGKTSLVRKVQSVITDPEIKVVFMDIYDCRNEYEFLNRFAAILMKEVAGRMDRVMDTLKEFLIHVVPQISFSPAPQSDFSLSLGITPQTYSPEQILNLPEVIAKKRGIHIIVCIDEFQQVGEFPDSLNVQKRMRGAWQHHEHASYCMFGSKKHMMMKIFQSKRMPFYQFGDTMFLQKIPKEDWVKFIRERFAISGKSISEEYAGRICDAVNCYSSYVQQLASNVFLETENETDEQCFAEGLATLLNQNSELFMNMIGGLTSFQMNFLRAVCTGYHSEYTSKEVSSKFDLGAKSNVTRIKTSLREKELIDIQGSMTYIADPVFELWFKREYM